ncbi:MAG: hypothetical protein Q7T21_00715 [Gallionella sp.]|nr:hypothetical protein [Gallionella sp.]
MYDLFIHQANENADFLYLLQCGIEPEKPADKKVTDKAIEVMRQQQNFLQPLAQGVVALIGQDFFGAIGGGAETGCG